MKHWTPDEFKGVLERAAALKKEQPDIGNSDLWNEAQADLPKDRLRTMYSSTTARMNQRLLEYVKNKLTGKAVMQPAPAEAIKLVHFHSPSGFIIGVDERMTVAEMKRLGFFLKLVE